MVPSGRRAYLLTLLCGAVALPADRVIVDDVIETNPAGTSFISVSKLDSVRAIQCFTDWGNDGFGTCKILSLNTSTLTVLSTHVFNENTTHKVQVEAFSASTAVVCYSDVVRTQYVMCKSLTITGNTMGGGESTVISDHAPQVPFFSTTRFSQSEGVVCWTSSSDEYRDRQGVCNRLTLSGSQITAGMERYFEGSHSVTDISVQAFSGSEAVLCHRSQGVGTCALLTLGGASGEVSIATADSKDFWPASEAFLGVSVVAFGEDSGAVCYSGGTGHNHLGCKALSISGPSLEMGAEETLISSYPSAWLTSTSIADNSALLCYAAQDQQALSTYEEFKGKGTCNVIGVLGGAALEASPPSEVRGDPTDSLSVAGLGPGSAALCFSNDGAGAGGCLALSLPPTTTSTTATATTGTSTSLSETSSTTPHTTTETSATTLAIWVAAADWSECSNTCGQGERTRNVTCTAGNESLCDLDDRVAASTQECQRYSACDYDWTCPMGPDEDSGEGCGAQKAVVFTALCAAAALAAVLASVSACRLRNGAGVSNTLEKDSRVPDAATASSTRAPGLPDHSDFGAFVDGVLAMEEARASGERRTYPRAPQKPRGLDLAHPAGVLAGASLGSAALELAAGRALSL